MTNFEVLQQFTFTLHFMLSFSFHKNTFSEDESVSSVSLHSLKYQTKVNRRWNIPKCILTKVRASSVRTTVKTHLTDGGSWMESRVCVCVCQWVCAFGYQRVLWLPEVTATHQLWQAKGWLLCFISISVTALTVLPTRFHYFREPFEHANCQLWQLLCSLSLLVVWNSIQNNCKSFSQD